MVLAELVVILLIVIIFGAGMPVLYYLLFVYLVCSYWIYKCLILKFYRSSDSFSEKLSIDFLRVLKLGLIIHMVSTYDQITNKTILPGKYSAISVSSKELHLLHYHHDLREQEHGFVYLSGCIGLLIVYLIIRIVQKYKWY